MDMSIMEKTMLQELWKPVVVKTLLANFGGHGYAVACFSEYVGV
jgi:hypothetical protein